MSGELENWLVLVSTHMVSRSTKAPKDKYCDSSFMRWLLLLLLLLSRVSRVRLCVTP